MIETVRLSKRYGDRVALDDVSLSVPAGSVCGLVGRNGAGKTTLLSLLAGLRRASSGEYRIDAPRQRVAVFPDAPRFDSWLTGSEVVRLALQLSDPKFARSSASAGRVGEVLDDAGLTDAAGREVGGYSRGMLQRLGVACTIVARPDVILLDEPASALDPGGRREVLDLIAAMRGGSTALFSSHILDDVQAVCDTVAVLDDGRLLFHGPLSSLLVGKAVPRYIVRLRPPMDTVMVALRDETWVTGVEAVGADQLVVEVSSVSEAETRLAAALAAAGARVVSLGPEEVTLERAFLELTG